MKDVQVRTNEGACTMFGTLEEAQKWASQRWDRVYKVSYTDDAGDRIILYPMGPNPGEYETVNQTEQLNQLVRMTEEAGGYDDLGDE